MFLKKHISLTLLAVLFSGFLLGQQTKIYTDEYKDYRDGLELFDKQKYAAAQEKFNKTIAQISNKHDEIQVNAEYMKAQCALYLFNLDAQFLLKQFMLDHPDANQTKKVPFILGRDYYRKKDYRDAIEWFEKVDEYDLDRFEIIEFHFKYGYSLFIKEKYDLAEQHFYEIKDIESEYFAPANYYYGHLAYLKGNYQTALESFRKIDDTPGFGPIVPYYIAQILFNQEKYKEVIDYVPGILEREKIKREGEIEGIVGSAYFKLDEYEKAIPYLEGYFKKAKTRTEDDYYQLGFSYYKTGNYDKAIKYLGRVAANDDERAQICNYILAECYIKTDNKEYSKAAFKRAYDLGHDKLINEDALFGYAKTTYEISYNPYDGAVDIFHKFLDEFPNSSKKETVYEYLIDMYSTTKDFEAALKSIDKIKDKNFQIKEAYQTLSYNLGVESFFKQEYAKAIASFNNVKKYMVSPELNALSKFWIAEVKFNEGKYTEAISAYNTFKSTSGAANTEPYDLVDYNIGYAFFNQKKYDDAITAFRNFVRRTKDTEREADANLRLGDAYYTQKDDNNAVKYYSRAVVEGTANNDYALYQQAIIKGYSGENDDKEELLARLLREYPNSIYAKNSQYELANTYRNQRKDDEALAMYQQIVDNSPDGEQKRKALLNIGGIHLRNENFGSAEDVFENLIRNYPNTNESEAAINELERAYALQNKIDQFPELLSTLGVKYSQGRLDSTLWLPAEEAYIKGDCDAAKRALETYLTKIKNPRNKVKANFYLAECANLAGNEDEALTYYNLVIAFKSSHLEDALFRAADITYKRKDYKKANEYLTQLEPINREEIRIPAIQKGLMRTSYEIQDYNKAILYAGRILSNDDTKGSLEEEALMIKANSNYELRNYSLAKPIYQQVVKKSNDVDKAIAKYRVCEILFAEKKYKDAEDELFDFFQQKPTYDYWLGKGYILLSDVYVKLGDNFQAKETLKSVINNYVLDDDIIPTAQQKLDKIKKDEASGDVTGEEDEIEINGNNR